MPWILEASRRLAAPADRVASVLADLPAYRRWNPWTEVEGPLRVGGRLRIRARVLGVIWPVPVRVVELEPGRIVWELESPASSVLRARRTQTVTASGPDACTYTSHETFGGAASSIVGGVAGWDLRRGLSEMMDALATLVEARASTP